MSEINLVRANYNQKSWLVDLVSEVYRSIWRSQSLVKTKKFVHQYDSIFYSSGRTGVCRKISSMIEK